MLKTKKQRPAVIEHFYCVLDDRVGDTLTEKQKQAVERAVLDVTFTKRHSVDVRRSFPFFTRRYYFVFLLGRVRQRTIYQESILFQSLVTLGVMLLILFSLTAIFILVYLIKSALGIDIFPHYHLGLWAWLVGHN